MTMTKAGKQYLTAVRRTLRSNRAQKRQLLSDLRTRIEEFTQQSPHANYDALCGVFGAPQALADAYLETECGAVLSRRVARKRTVLAAVIAALLAALLLWGGMVWSLWREGHANLNGTVQDVLVDGTVVELELGAAL